jgi:hypothetical protein
MPRLLALGLCVTAALAIAGCTQDGSYRVTWNFLATADPGAAVQSAAEGCGQHGVDAIFVTASDTNADGDQVLAICTLGQITRPVPAGTWSIQVQAVDAQATLIGSIATQMVSGVVADGAVTELGLVTLTPRPACDDGIDNDGDGRVDLDDPGCDGNPSGTHE